jgi:hypothetical protein
MAGLLATIGRRRVKKNKGIKGREGGPFILLFFLTFTS